MPFESMCCFVGGLGANQFTHGNPSPLQQVQTANERCLCIPVNDRGYLIGQLPDLNSLILSTRQQNPSIKRVVIVDHSFGWITGKHAALAGLVDFLIAMDAVGLPFISEDHWPHPNGVKQPGSLWKANSTPFIKQLGIIDGPSITTLDCDHNQIAHRTEVVQAIIEAVRV